MCKFWWGSQENEKKIHWIDWEKMCWPKEAGGMGFRDLHHFNLAMLAKQGWKLVHETESLVAKILKARYYPTSNFLKAHIGANPSFTWRSIMEGRDLLLKGIIWRVGTGSFIEIRNDPWIPDLEGFRIMDPNQIPEHIQTVAHIILQNPVRWDREMISSSFSDQDAKAILELPLNQTSREDNMFCFSKKRGNFSVKSAYKLAWKHHICSRIQKQHPRYHQFNMLQ